MRADPANGITEGYEWDYFIKDHLGNVRMVLTEEVRQDGYPAATMETASATTEEAVYANLSQTRVDKPAGYPYDPYLDPNGKVAKVRGDGQKIGPAITLKVMAGDRVNLRVSSWYATGGVAPQPPNPITDLVGVLATSFAGVSGGKAAAQELTGSGVLTPGVNRFLSAQPTSFTKPKAFVNWVLFDEQFQYVGASSGAEPVGGDGELTTHLRNGLPVEKNGYLYVYVSNETPNLDVFFDNLQVTHIRGPLLEETHYYPFGLTMAGISSRAAAFDGTENKRKFNDGTELNTTFNIDLYETNFRSLDPQLGRFWQVDPLADAAYEFSPFAYGNDNPITYNDPLGLLSDSAHKAITLENVTVTANPKIGNQFLPYINFDNGRQYSVASYKDWPLKLNPKERSNDLLDSWAMGYGAENRVYLPNHPMTKRLQNAYRISLARAYFYKKYLTDFKNGKSLKGASVTDYDGAFGLTGLILARTDIVEQFVGTFDVDIHVDEKG